mgnify:CR=1 FL=1
MASATTLMPPSAARAGAAGRVPLADGEAAAGMVMPLLLPDAPVVAWWPGDSPQVPAKDPIGLLAQRRITDAKACPDPVAAIRSRADGYVPGDTDLAWTRLTPWRSLLAAAFDQPVGEVTEGVVEGATANPSVCLLAA